VDIGAPFTAQLPQLSFEGATKRNRPNLQAGDVVYARVVSANRDQEPVLSCVDGTGRAAGFGPLKDGYTAGVSTAHARQLLAKPPAPVLLALGQALQYELAIGLNGKVRCGCGRRCWRCCPCRCCHSAGCLGAEGLAGATSQRGRRAAAAAGVDQLAQHGKHHHRGQRRRPLGVPQRRAGAAAGQQFAVAETAVAAGS
jgi:hypothetical protein